MCCLPKKQRDQQLFKQGDNTMKILTIMGIPRKRGNTAEVLKMFEDRISKHHETERINLVSADLNACKGCWSSQAENNKAGCVQKDDFQQIFERMRDSAAYKKGTSLE